MLYNMLSALYSDERGLLDCQAWVMVLMGLFCFPILQRTKVPYGRYGTSLYGPPVPVRLAWFIQELPSLAIPVSFYLKHQEIGLVNTVLLGAFVCHYSQRTIIYSFLIRGGKDSPFVPVVLAFLFCSYNGYLQSSYLCRHASFSSDWIYDPRFITGIILFLSGMFINIYSDHILRNLRKPGETGYKIPRGGLFEYVSAANFFGEILEWFGFAVAGWSLPAAAFSFFTASVLTPRAQEHHKWYLEKFEDYPKTRKILIPFIY
ncbi:hypothetical protein GDO86_011353 [Hymenochirus boettgeri]|uniref:3-oxo-5alpha-steroid 4-dehydrogenase (NADP(+)) n=1 Tax=Hymenochirus boettgeri TaxID=247094 RepID=A0A8T2JIT2_9PIPI|nr:hypothetical protein GDO86_011353 [Hymenochirus boettgeri]